MPFFIIIYQIEFISIEFELHCIAADGMS
jgi:hypothetical protein